MGNFSCGVSCAGKVLKWLLVVSISVDAGRLIIS